MNLRYGLKKLEPGLGKSLDDFIKVLGRPRSQSRFLDGMLVGWVKGKQQVGIGFTKDRMYNHVEYRINC